MVLKELTDWHNLFQGGIGSLMGSAIGVLGAYILAVKSIQGQLDVERRIFREREGLSAAREIRKSLKILAGQVDAVKMKIEIGFPVDGLDVDEGRNTLRGLVDEFDEVLGDASPWLPEWLLGRLRFVYVKSARMAVPFAKPEWITLEEVTLLSDQLYELQLKLDRYQVEPARITKKMSRIDRRARRKEWLRKAPPALLSRTNRLLRGLARVVRRSRGTLGILAVLVAILIIV